MTTETVSESGKRPYYQHIHLLRGFTIAWIVATHATTLPLVVSRIGGRPHGIIGEFQSLLFYNSTVMFAMISGMLYSLVLARKPAREFYRGKVRNVLSPYLVISALYAFLGLTVADGLNLPDGIGDFLQRYAIGVLTGTTMSVLWYIPVILLLFLLTPLFARALRSRFETVFLLACLSLPFFFSRIWPDFSFNNVAYFAAPYVFGMWLGAAYPERSQLLYRGRWWIALVALFTSAWSFGTIAELTPPYSYDWRTQLYYLQKFSLSLLVVLAFQRLEARRSKLLERFGEDAFAIYFFHMLPIIVYGIIMLDIGGPLTRIEVLVHAAALSVASMAISVGLVAIVRRLAGSKSRLLVGS